MTVPLACVGREKLADDRLAAQRRERQRLDKLLGIGGHDDLYLGTGFDEQPCECGTLVCCDSARDAQDNVLAFQHDALVALIVYFLYWM